MCFECFIYVGNSPSRLGEANPHPGEGYPSCPHWEGHPSPGTDRLREDSRICHSPHPEDPLL